MIIWILLSGFNRNNQTVPFLKSNTILTTPIYKIIKNTFPFYIDVIIHLINLFRSYLPSQQKTVLINTKEKTHQYIVVSLPGKRRHSKVAGTIEKKPLVWVLINILNKKSRNKAQ